MTIHDLLIQLAGKSDIAFIVLAALPMVTFVIGFLHGVYDARKTPWRQLYSLIIHLTTLPLVTLLSWITYRYIVGGNPLEEIGIFLPGATVLSWLLTLLFVKRVVDYVHLAGFPGLPALVVEEIIAWAIALFLFWGGYDYVFDSALLSLLATFLIAFVFLHALFMAVYRRSHR